MSELWAQTEAHVAGREVPAPAKFAHPIAFNCVPQIDDFLPSGYTKEEMKMVNETRKIMGDDSIDVCPTCVRVPVLYSHSESILVETERPITPEAGPRGSGRRRPGLTIVDDPAAKQYPLPDSARGRDDVFVGRIRQDLARPERPALLVRQRQPPQGRGDQRGADRRGTASSSRGRRRLTPSMRNIKLVIAYDGTDFSGWQRQPDRRTVQQVLEEAIGQLTGVVPATNASGRTDAGVHALGQVVHFYTASRHAPAVFVKALNAMLPADVRVKGACGDAPVVPRDARRQDQALPLRDRQRPDRRPVPAPLRLSRPSSRSTPTR